MSSMSFSAPSAYAALLKADRVMGGTGELALHPADGPNFELQQAFCQMLAAAPASYIEGLPEIKTEAGSPAIVNAFFKRHNFDIEVSGGWAVGAILDVLVEWVEMGVPCHVETKEGEYHAFKLDNNVKIFQINRHIQVAQIKTKTPGRHVYVSMSDAPADIFDLWHTAVSLQLRCTTEAYGFKGLICPMINHNDKPDISFLVGLRGKHLPTIQDAAQQNRLRMNYQGARAESATGTALEFLASPPLYIDHPFLFWVVDEGQQMPLFAAYLDKDSWADPGDL